MRTKLFILGILAFVTLAPQGISAQAPAPQGGPAPAQAGDDPSMAPLTKEAQPVLPPEKIQNPESTVGLAPSDQPVNNAKPRVAGLVVPSAEETAAHMPSIYEHDRQPTISHTFNLTDQQKRMIVDALAQDKGTALPKDGIAESVVLPASVAVKDVPERIVSELPWLRGYGYAKDGTRIVLVDPYLRFVAAVLE